MSFLVWVSRIRRDLHASPLLLGILSYFTVQRPITSVTFSFWNSLWIVVHLCRSIRIVQIGCRLRDIRWCLHALARCLKLFGHTLIALFWLLIVAGSILFTVDVIESNGQYRSVRSTVLSAHETLYAIGYRNNAPHGYFTRLWTIVSIYSMSSLVQILLWYFQIEVTGQCKKLLSTERRDQLQI